MFSVTALAATVMISAGHCGGCSADHAATKSPTIVQVAAADGRFTTLVAAVDAAGLTDTLNSKGDYTVFAPTDAAFKQLPDGTVATSSSPRTRKPSRGSFCTTSSPATSTPLTSSRCQALSRPTASVWMSP